MKGKIWKIVTIAILVYVLLMGFLGNVPQREILNETIRNLYFHVPMWFSMVFLFGASVFYAIRFLISSNYKYDALSVEFANVGILFGFLGITTGMIWAQFTWGAWWSFDPKQNGAAITLLIYLAYMVLRNSMPENNRKSKAIVSGAYNALAFGAMIPLIFILPRMSESLHPGAEGNPAFNSYDLDGNMRLVFYPAVIGWIMLGLWFTELRVRIKRIKYSIDEKDL